MNKILNGLQGVLDVVSGSGPAGRITSFIGGPYYKDVKRCVIQHRLHDEWMVWNWDTAEWDRVKQPVSIVAP